MRWLIYATKKPEFQFYIFHSLDADCLDKSRCARLKCITETSSSTCCAQAITSTIDSIQWTWQDNLQPHSARHVLTMATSFCVSGKGHNRDKQEYCTDPYAQRNTGIVTLVWQGKGYFTTMKNTSIPDHCIQQYRQCACNVTLRRFRELLPLKSNKYYIF